ncbi:MAG: 30S ribosomal protein S9 [Bacteroidetes bacterium]|jgi:small subunit ribosomal protein S9|nr:MAG: 30S ribosomal protein S9 [Bacteroidota bacterium]
MSQVIQVGRRKQAVARVFVNESGAGKIQINQRELTTYFPQELLQMKVMEPFRVLDINASQFDITVNVDGGGINGQAEAIRLGISRALMIFTPDFRPPLKKAGLVTRDSRRVERKKPGKRKARKSTQFSKR